MLSLYLELLVIRWLSSDVRAFTVFRTFPLITCFIGLGLGYVRQNNRDFVLTPLFLALFTLIMNLSDKLPIASIIFPSFSVYQWLEKPGSQFGSLFLFVFILLAFLVFPFLICMGIGSRLGILFNSLKQLPAYAVNLLGSGLGSIAFTIICFCLGASPAMLLIIPTVVLFYFMFKEKHYASAVTLFLIPIILIFLLSSPQTNVYPELGAALDSRREIFWSPYQRLELTTFKLKNAPAEKSSILGLNLVTNRLFYQSYFDDDLDRTAIPTVLGLLLDQRHRHYSVPYQIKQNARDVLIVGAGTGQNVEAAIKNHASAVDAVEIDPIILKLGKQFDRYYDNPAVHLVCDDARHFFNTSKKKYDVIVFALLDSHTVVGQGSSVRLDAYVYTKQSFQRALSLLKPDGILFLSFAKTQPWITTRLYETLKSAYAGPILILNYTTPSFGAGSCFICGAPQDKDFLEKLQSRLGNDWQVAAPFDETQLTHSLLTDDWPYLYVKPNMIDYPYLSIVLLIILLSAFLTRKIIFNRNAGSLCWQLFFLGAAFMLLELQSIARLSLIFGSTWLTSAIVINGILMLIFSANLLVIKFQETISKHILAIYILLFVSLLASFSLPICELSMIVSNLGAFGPFIISLITLLPLLCAGLIFPVAFAQVDSAPRALAFNLLGAVIGGLLEYLSYYTGNNGLILVSSFLYLCSFIFFLRYSRTKV